MIETATFLAVLGVKLVVESLGRVAENCYLTHRHRSAAVLSGLTAATSIPVGRLAIRDGSDSAAVAIVLAVVVTTYCGSRRLERMRT